jgi:hypothetical protein
VRSGRIRDIQPVRDLSFGCDLLAIKLIGIKTFHLTNVLIWSSIIFITFQILLRITGQSALTMGLTACFALHPVFVGSVAWISARKHLLSCLFIAIATLLIMIFAEDRARKLRSVVLAILFYSLSIFAQPITLLWPSWAALYLWLRRAERRTIVWFIVACSPALVVCAALNGAYYTGRFVEQTGAEKFVSAPGALGVSFLALGRYFVNLIIPIKLATTYNPGSTLNLIGLFLFVVFVFAAIKGVGTFQALPWLWLYLFPLLTVTARMTNIFVSDTYLLTPALGMVGVLGRVGVSFGDVWSKRAAGFLIAAAVGCALLSSREVRAWESDAALWAHAYSVEPTPNALAKRAYYLAQEGRTTEAIEAALRLGVWAPAHGEYPYVLARAVYLDKNLSTDQKLKFLQEHPVEDPWFDYYLAALLARQGRSKEAFGAMRAGLAKPRAFKSELATVAAEALALCKRAENSECDGLLVPLRRQPEWNEASFMLRLRSLSGTSSSTNN